MVNGVAVLDCNWWVSNGLMIVVIVSLTILPWDVKYHGDLKNVRSIRVLTFFLINNYNCNSQLLP